MVDEVIAEIICRRRRQLLVHSCIYYRMDTNLITDYTFDNWSMELVELQRNHPKEAAAAVYSEEFEGFDGASGFDLPHGYPEIVRVASRLVASNKIRGRKK